MADPAAASGEETGGFFSSITSAVGSTLKYAADTVNR